MFRKRYYAFVILCAGHVALLIAFLSCGEDRSVSIECSEPHIMTSSVTMEEELKNSGVIAQSQAHYIFFVNEHDVVLASIREPSISLIGFMLQPKDVDAIRAGYPVDIVEREEIERFAEMFISEESKMDISRVMLVGIVFTFDDCMLQCCGGEECSWGRIKYCIGRCSDEYEPKPREE